MITNSRDLLNKSVPNDVPQMTVIEKFQPTEVIKCDSKDDFIKIINNDISKYNQLTTNKLNKMFIIPGYRITKIHGVIGLRKSEQQPMIVNDDTQTLEHELERLSNSIHKLQQDNVNIKSAFNQLSDEFEHILSVLK